ncbi:MAG: hypothetical protein AABY11_02740 [archaeon]
MKHPKILSKDIVSINIQKSKLFGFGLILVFGLFFTSSQYVEAQSTAPTQQLHRPIFEWDGQTWKITQANGITATWEKTNIVTIEGTGTQSGWQSFGQLQKKLNSNTASVDIASYPLPAGIGTGSFWFLKDEQNAIIIEKHRDTIFPHYNSNLFIVERINGNDTHAFVHVDPPSRGWDNYRIAKISGGFEVYYNNILVYTGSIDIANFDEVRISAHVNGAGDQVKSAFKNYQE